MFVALQRFFCIPQQRSRFLKFKTLAFLCCWRRRGGCISSQRVRGLNFETFVFLCCWLYRGPCIPSQKARVLNFMTLTFLCCWPCRGGGCISSQRLMGLNLSAPLSFRFPRRGIGVSPLSFRVCSFAEVFCIP